MSVKSIGAAVLAFAALLQADVHAQPATKPAASEPVQAAAAGLPAELTIQKTSAGRVFADAKGLTLYSSDRDPAGKSTCNGSCERTWSPVRAPGMANAGMGDWTAVRRDDGTKQWAYKGKPLYTFVSDTKPGEMRGDGADGVWRVALVPMPPLPAVPRGVTAQAADIGRVLADGKGLTLYTFDRDTEPGKSACVDACAEAWPPLVATANTQPVADWTVITRNDGSKQWAFKGKPVYTFSRDAQAGDTTGDGVANTWHAVKV